MLKQLIKKIFKIKDVIVEKEILIPTEVLSNSPIKNAELQLYVKKNKETNFTYTTPINEAIDMILQGDKFNNMNDFKEALYWYSSSLKIYPTAIGYCRRSFIYSHLNKFNLAFMDAMQACVIDGHNWVAYNNMGVCKLKTKEYDVAINFFREALKYEKNSKILYNLALAQEKSGDWINAINSYKETFDLDPMNNEALNSFIKLKALLN